MFGIIAMAIAAVVVKKLEDASDYKTPKGKNRNRYR